MRCVPTYEYRCDACDKNFDVVQSFHDDPLTECPTCGSPVRKVFGSVGIVFKGSGFYKTDSRSGGGSASRPAESASSGSSDQGSGDSGSGSDSSTTPSSGGSSDGSSTSDSSKKTEKSTSSTESSAGSSGKGKKAAPSKT